MSPQLNLLKDARRLQEAGRLPESEVICRQIITADPQNIEAWQLLGELGYQAGNYEAAIICSDQALRLLPTFVPAIVNRARALKAQKKFDEAIECFRQALTLAPASPDLHSSLGNALLDNKQFDEAIDCYRRALELKPDWPEMYYNIGGALHDQGSSEQALSALEKALELRPSYPEAHFNLGVIFGELGRINEASAHYRAAIELQPENPAPHHNESFLMLVRGEVPAGWHEYEWRWKVGQPAQPKYSGRKWSGEDLTGKTILLRAEQGLGDTLQFIRYAQLLKKRGATVVAECQPPLLQILSRTPGIDRLISTGDNPPDFDFYSPLLSLPAVFETALVTIPAQVPYLFADPDLINQWRDKLQNIQGFKIGIGWSGRPQQGPWKRRDVPLEAFGQLAHIPGIRFINLQHKPRPEDSTKARKLLQIVELGDDLDQTHGGFMDTAAIMLNLDLVITSDTSLPHLAGALGVPVYLALPHIPDWRWLLGRSDSPWYPTMRLFRQKQPGDWATVFQDIRAALAERGRSTQS